MPPNESANQTRPWLLDHNMPAQLAVWLNTHGIPCSTVRQQRWEEISNGELVLNASTKFQVLLTRDQGFSDAAANRLRESNLAVVLVNISQARAKEYIRHFEEAWKSRPINPEPGKVIEWP